MVKISLQKFSLKCMITVEFKFICYSRVQIYCGLCRQFPYHDKFIQPKYHSILGVHCTNWAPPIVELTEQCALLSPNALPPSHAVSSLLSPGNNIHPYIVRSITIRNTALPMRLKLYTEARKGRPQKYLHLKLIQHSAKIHQPHR